MRLVVLCLLACPAFAGECDSVGELFRSRGHYNTGAFNKTKGSDLAQCPSEVTCCLKSTEEMFEILALRDFRKRLKNTSLELVTLIATANRKLQESFVRLVSLSSRSVTALLVSAYPFLSAGGPSVGLAADLLSHAGGRRVPLQDRVHAFFDGLLPRACDPHTIKALNGSFMPLASVLASRAEEVFAWARGLLAALHAGLEAVHSASRYSPTGAECAFSALALCPACAGGPLLPPCHSLCLGVARGCVARLQPLARPWAQWAGALVRATRTTREVERFLANMDEEVARVVRRLLENADQTGCAAEVSLPPRVRREVVAEEGPMSGALSRLAAQLAAHKSFFFTLADRVCDQVAPPSGKERCWNGTTPSPVVGAQKLNPEMPEKQSLDCSIYELAEKLRYAKQVLTPSVLGPEDSFDASGALEEEESSVSSCSGIRPSALLLLVLL